MYRTLDPDKISETIEALGERIASRFPGSGLSRVSSDLIGLARQTRERVVDVSRAKHVPGTSDRVDIALAKGDVANDRDFILDYRLAGDTIESGVLLHQGPDENFFLARIEPPKNVVATDTKASFFSSTDMLFPRSAPNQASSCCTGVRSGSRLRGNSSLCRASMDL